MMKVLKDKKIIMLIVLSLIYFIIFPPFDMPDEIGHFRRSFEVSLGRILSGQDDQNQGVNYLPGNSVPEIVLNNEYHIKYRDWPELYECRLDYDHWEYVVNKFQSLNSPLSYFAQAVGVFLGRMMTDRVVIIYYVAKFLNMLLSLALVIAGYHMMPKHKNAIIYIACTPYFVAQMASLSVDAGLNAMTLFFFAYVCKIKYGKERINGRSFFLLTASAIVIASCKLLYFPIVFLICMIPAAQFDGNITKGRIKKCAACLIPILFGMMWSLLVSTYAASSNPGANTGEQIIYVLKNPIRYLFVLVRMIVMNIPYYTVESVMVYTVIQHMSKSGFVLWFLAILSVVYVANFMCAMLCSDQGDHGSSLSKDHKFRWTLIGITVIEIVLIFSAGYARWTEVGASVIRGVQGRYFIPVWIFIAFLLAEGKLREQMQKRRIGRQHKRFFHEGLSMGIVLMVNGIFLLSGVAVWLN